jgi:tetratricopeptide (TPR) repeat protein
LKTFRKKTGKKKGQFTQPDEFQSITRRVMDYVQANTKQVYIALGALAAVVVIIIVVSMLMSASRAKLVAKQAEALKYYDINSPAPGKQPMGVAERLTKATELFSEVAKSAGGSPIGVRALYYKASAEMDMGDTDNAIKDYKEASAKAGSDKLMTSLTAMRLAGAYANKGDVQAAIEAYMGIIKADGGYLKDEAHMRLGEIYEMSGQKDKAVSEYRAVEKEFPDSPWARDAKSRADALEGIAQAEAAAAPMQPAGVQVVPLKAGKETAKPAPAKTEKKSK